MTVHEQGGASRRARRHHDEIVGRRRRIVLLAGAAAVVLLAGGATVFALTRSEETDEEEENVILLADYSIAGSLAVRAGDVRVVVANGGDVTHTLGVRNGPITALLMPGRASTLELLDLAPGTYELYCSLHEDRGMVSALQVVAATPGSEPTATE